MKKISNFIVALATLMTPFLSLTNLASAANKNIQINSNIDALVFFGDHIENVHGADEVVGTMLPVDANGKNDNIDDSLLVYVSIETDQILNNAKLTSIKINDEVQTITSPIGRNIYRLSPAES